MCFDCHRRSHPIRVSIRVYAKSMQARFPPLCCMVSFLPGPNAVPSVTPVAYKDAQDHRSKQRATPSSSAAAGPLTQGCCVFLPCTPRQEDAQGPCWIPNPVEIAGTLTVKVCLARSRAHAKMPSRERTSNRTLLWGMLSLVLGRRAQSQAIFSLSPCAP